MEPDQPDSRSCSGAAFGIDIVRFAILGDKTAFITFSMIAVVFMLVAYMAWKSRMPFLYLLIAAAAFHSVF